MKRITCLFTICFFTMISLMAQNNAKINYQMVVRNANNELLSNQSGINVTISLYNGESDTTLAFAERHTVSTNINGLASLLIGNGTPLQGAFSDVRWNIARIKTEIEIPGDSTVSVTRPINAVPHTLFADEIAEQALLDLLEKNNYVDSTDVADMMDSLNLIIDSLVAEYGRLEKLVCLPTIQTKAVSEIGEKYATCGGSANSLCDVAISERGIVWGTQSNPTFTDNVETAGSGSGLYTITIMGLTDNKTYHVRAYLIAENDTIFGADVEFSTIAACGNQIVTDYDQNQYNTIQIGNTCWLKQNLKSTHYADGTEIPFASSTTSTPARYYVHNSDTYTDTYGYLYNWPAAMNGSGASDLTPSKTQGICPNGWHMPSTGELDQLISDVNANMSNRCNGANNSIAVSLASNGEWQNSGTWQQCSNIRNNTQFSAMPAGQTEKNNSFGQEAWFWTTSYYDNGYYYAYYLSYNSSTVAHLTISPKAGCSIRCVRNY